MHTITVSRTVDARGLPEPEPTLALVEAMRPAAVGEVVELLSSDPDSYRFVVGYVTTSCHDVVLAAWNGDGWRFLISKSPRATDRRTGQLGLGGEASRHGPALGSRSGGPLPVPAGG